VRLDAHLFLNEWRGEGTMIKIGAKAPAFCLPSADREKVCLKDFSGRWAVLYFYPKDNTGG
jgi:peroxiredoxin Q/BCP